jgi:hypothetical protein
MEREYKNILREKQNELNRIMQEIQDIRHANGIPDSTGSSSNSPDGSKKKKSSTLNIFR